MLKPTARHLVASSLIFLLAGCASATKQSKSTTTTSTNPFVSQSKKVQQDLTQTQTDLGSLESEIKVGK